MARGRWWEPSPGLRHAIEDEAIFTPQAAFFRIDGAVLDPEITTVVEACRLINWEAAYQTPEEYWGEPNPGLDALALTYAQYDESTSMILLPAGGVYHVGLNFAIALAADAPQAAQCLLNGENSGNSVSTATSIPEGEGAYTLLIGYDTTVVPLANDNGHPGFGGLTPVVSSIDSTVLTMFAPASINGFMVIERIG